MQLQSLNASGGFDIMQELLNELPSKMWPLTYSEYYDTGVMACLNIL